MDRQLALGIGTAFAGTLLLLALLAAGSIRHPVAASERTGTVEFVAIGVGLVLVTIGVVVALATFAVEERSPPP